MRKFADIWPQLVEYAREEETVETFRAGNKNDVQYDSERDAIRFNSRATEDEYWTPISRDTWKTAWLNLQETGELRPRQFFDITSVRRGSIAVPFLQEALDLPADPDERIVYPAEDDCRRV